MTNIECPYDDLELKLALLSLHKKIDSYAAKKDGERGQAMEKLAEKMGKIKIDASDKQAVASHHNIELEQLLNSKNYQTLVDEYAQFQTGRILGLVKKELGASDREAWAMLFVAAGQFPL